MRTIIRIAKLELSTLFYSPIAWFILVIFLYQCGMEYSSILENAVMSQELKSGFNTATFLTARLFGPSFGFYPRIIGKLYLYIPLLTMGLMSRETSSGTINLLYSSPIKVRSIIYGKFLAMMVYNFILLLIIGIYVIAGLIHIRHADAGLLFSGLLGIYLLLCTYAAIGLFMSSLTSYQVVAALCTLVTFALLSYIGTIWQDIDFVRDLTYFLSISGRAENMLGGLITSKDLLYFLLVIFIFLGLSIYKLQAGQESGSKLLKVSRYVGIVAIALFIGYMSSRPRFIAYYDATATKTRTLSANVQKIMHELGKNSLEVTSYINLMDRRFYAGSPRQRNNDMARWEPYLRFKPDIKFNYVYYYDSVPGNFGRSNPGMTLEQIAQKNAKTYKADFSNFMKPEAIRKIIDLRPEENRYVMQLSYKGKKTFLRLYNDIMVFPSETETAAALKRLMVKLPRIAFVQGELERSIEKTGDRDYKTLTNEITFRYALVNQGFDVDTVSLEREAIPEDIAALVIADPKTPFSNEALTKIRQYLDTGGNLLIAGEPGKQAILNPVLEPLGVQMMNGTLVQESKNFSPDLVLPYLTPVAAHLSKAVQRAFEDSLVVSMPGLAGLSYQKKSGFKVQPLLMTDSNVSWNKLGKLVLDSADVAYKPEEGDEKRSIPAALALTRNVGGKEQRIVVMGDADFLSNAELNRYNVHTANFVFNTAIMGWFTYGQFPIDTTRPRSEDTIIDQTGDGVGHLKMLYLGVFPGILLFTGIILLVRRRRK
ncbi:ABC-2 type transport system permease protein [bacterium A37T11]|nr:ABC-2 type transport system permease protein [bacterium A37T11]